MASNPEQNPPASRRRKVSLADPEVQARQRQWFLDNGEEWESAVPLEDAFADAQPLNSPDH